MNENDSNNPAIRYAIWIEYKKRCGYCGEDLHKLKNLTIDHIIPKKQFSTFVALWKAQSDLDGYFDNFEIDSLRNLFPSCFACNREKSDWAYQVEHDIRLINKAVQLEGAIQKSAKDFIREAEFSFKQLVEEHNKNKFNSLVTTHSFLPGKHISDESVQIITKNIFINGFTPTIDQIKGSAIVGFAIDNNEIWNLSHSNLKKLWNSTDSQELINHFSQGQIEGKYFVNYESISKHYSAQIIHEMADALFEFLQIYRSRYYNALESWGTKETDFNDSEMSSWLFSMERKVWSKLVRFAKKT